MSEVALLELSSTVPARVGSYSSEPSTSIYFPDPMTELTGMFSLSSTPLSPLPPADDRRCLGCHAHARSSTRTNPRDRISRGQHGMRHVKQNIDLFQSRPKESFKILQNSSVDMQVLARYFLTNSYWMESLCTRLSPQVLCWRQHPIPVVKQTAAM